jgi:hypothetical protein
LFGDKRQAVLLGTVTARPSRELCPTRDRKRSALCEFKQPLALAAECDDRDEDRLVAIGADRCGGKWALGALSPLRIADEGAGGQSI